MSLRPEYETPLRRMDSSLFTLIALILANAAPTLAGVINFEARPDGTSMSIDAPDPSNKTVAINMINNFNIGGCCSGDKVTTTSTTTSTTTPTTANTSPWILLVGGIVTKGAAAGVDDVELFSLREDTDPIPSCLKNLQRYPLPLFYSAGGLDASSGIPFVCGGTKGLSGLTDLCYRYNSLQNSWTKLGRLPVPRSHQGFSSHPSLGLFLSGGYLLPSTSSAAWSTTDGMSIRTTHEQMPSALWAPCQVTIDDDTIMVFGGRNSQPDDTNKAFEYKIGANKWIELPGMPSTRSFEGCGVVRNPVTGHAESVVVAGGNPSRKTADIFDLTTRTWSNGSPLPQIVAGSTSLPYKNTFVMIGGFNTTVNLDTVYEYDTETKAWKLLPGRLSRPKREVAAIPVSKDLFPKCG